MTVVTDLAFIQSFYRAFSALSALRITTTNEHSVDMLKNVMEFFEELEATIEASDDGSKAI